MANLHASVSLAKISRPPPVFMTSASGQVIYEATTLRKTRYFECDMVLLIFWEYWIF